MGNGLNGAIGHPVQNHVVKMALETDNEIAIIRLLLMVEWLALETILKSKSVSMDFVQVIKYTPSELVFTKYILVQIPGTWGPWSSWSGCSITCGNENGSLAIRNRICNATPENGFLECRGNDKELALCNTGKCPCNYLNHDFVRCLLTMNVLLGLWKNYYNTFSLLGPRSGRIETFPTQHPNHICFVETNGTIIDSQATGYTLTLRVQFKAGHGPHVGFAFNYVDEKNFDFVYIRYG